MFCYITLHLKTEADKIMAIMKTELEEMKEIKSN